MFSGSTARCRRMSFAGARSIVTSPLPQPSAVSIRQLDGCPLKQSVGDAAKLHARPAYELWAGKVIETHEHARDLKFDAAIKASRSADEKPISVGSARVPAIANFSHRRSLPPAPHLQKRPNMARPRLVEEPLQPHHLCKRRLVVLGYADARLLTPCAAKTLG